MFILQLGIALQSNSILFFMPLFYQQNINATTKMALWSIEEPLSFFESKLMLSEEGSKPIMHPLKKIQHLAARYLLKTMVPHLNMNTIKYASNGKPYFENEQIQFSLSHCKGWAACVISDKASVGIDIEIIHERIQKIASKFLHSSELEKIKKRESLPNLTQLSLCWAAKEAMYKMYEQLGIDFSEQLRVESLPFLQKGKASASILTEASSMEVEIHYEQRENFVWAVCISE